VSSDLGRAVATARSVAARCGLELRLEPQLRERHFGICQGLTWEELQERHPAAHAALQARDPDFTPPGGESLRAFHARVVAGLTRIAERADGGRVAVIAHGGVIGIMYRHVQSIPLDAPRDYALPNASLNRFRFAGGRWQLEAWGDVSHLAAMRPGAADAAADDGSRVQASPGRAAGPAGGSGSSAI